MPLTLPTPASTSASALQEFESYDTDYLFLNQERASSVAFCMLWHKKVRPSYQCTHCFLAIKE